MLDTTMNSSFGKDATVDDLMNNHGIHGVQDLCSLLKRKGVPYFVEAGHWQESDVIERVANLCKAANAANSMKSGKVGLIGKSFHGMGDFAITPEDLENWIGTKVEIFKTGEIPELLNSLTEEEIKKEMEQDLS